MKIKGLSTANFKRFKNLRISDIEETVKLVVVVGPNGSGKSSLFDAFKLWHGWTTLGDSYKDDDYFRRSVLPTWNRLNCVQVEFHGPPPTRENDGCMYFRTAYRNEPDFSISSLSSLQDPTKGTAFRRLIDNDATVKNNYQRLVQDTITAVYSEENDAKTVVRLRHELIGRIQESMGRVFGDLVLNNISKPLESGTFRFKKGDCPSYHYKNLSGGEKAAFDLLLDLILKLPYYSDAVFFIDEPEGHMHTALQGRLLRELLAVIPDNSQLWVSTHSLGVMMAAKEVFDEAPGTVCVLDLDGHDFDQECAITPSRIDRVVWEKFLSIAVGDLAPSIAPEVIVLCEGSYEGRKRKNFDADIYGQIFGNKHRHVSFASGGGCEDLEQDSHIGEALLQSVLTGTRVFRALDLDDRSPEEAGKLREAGRIVLGRRNLESYLFDDEIIRLLAQGTSGQEGVVEEALKIRKDALDGSVGRDNAPDDLKSAAGEIYVGLKKLLGLTQCGNNTEAFMRSTLAPLVAEDTAVFAELEKDLIGPTLDT